MIIELEPTEAQYIYSKLLPMPYNEVSDIIKEFELKFKEHNEQLEAKALAEEKEQSKKDGKG